MRYSTLDTSTPFTEAFLLPATSFSHSRNMASVYAANSSTDENER